MSETVNISEPDYDWVDDEVLLREGRREAYARVVAYLTSKTVAYGEQPRLDDLIYEIEGWEP